MTTPSYLVNLTNVGESHYWFQLYLEENENLARYSMINAAINVEGLLSLVHKRIVRKQHSQM